MDVSSIELEPMTLVAFRHIGPYQEIGSQFGRLCDWINESGVAKGEMIAVYYDDPTEVPESELRSDAGMTVPASFALSDQSGPSIITVEGGRYAVATHMGSYEGLGNAWSQFMGTAIEEAGFELLPGPCFEKYINDCEEVPVEQVRTDLYARIR